MRFAIQKCLSIEGSELEPFSRKATIIHSYFDRFMSDSIGIPNLSWIYGDTKRKTSVLSIFLPSKANHALTHMALAAMVECSNKITLKLGLVVQGV